MSLLLAPTALRIPISLVNSPTPYQHCHYLPESFSAIENHTPRTVWLPLPDCLDIKNVMQSLAIFGEAPIFLKDYVKSRKHDWETACYIASASDREIVERVVKKFLELQGEELNGGLVFREFVELQSIGTHPRSRMPLTKEFRLFFLDGEILYWSRYWEVGAYHGETPPLEFFSEIAQNIESRFFTMDVAQCTNGEWLVIELGDGQVAGLPSAQEAEPFYRALRERVA